MFLHFKPSKVDDDNVSSFDSLSDAELKEGIIKIIAIKSLKILFILFFLVK
jgi:hypothetical protein